MRRVLDQSHASRINNSRVVFNIRIFLADCFSTFQEQAIGHFHDIGFVKDRNLVPLALTRVVEGPAGDAQAALFSRDLHARDDTGCDLIFDTAVKAFGVFPDDDDVDIIETSVHAL